MASPLQYKMRWPSEKKANGVGGASDFIPYVSNLANAFRKTPMPRAPKLIDPITGTHVNMDAERNDVTNATRAADLSTRDLDAQTGAAIRVGNQGNRFRALNDVNSKEASTNAQLDLHNSMINANINAQNAGMTNQYHDDVTEAQIAQQRNQSENLSNAADKYIGQQTVKDQMALDKEKTTILSKMYNQGVYGRLQKSLSDSGIDIPGANNNATPGSNSFDSYKSKVGGDLPQSAYETTSLDNNSLSAMKKFMKLRDVYAAGGMMKAYAGGGDVPVKPRPQLVKPLTPSRGEGSIAGRNAFSDNTFAMDNSTNRTAHGIDLINSNISSGILPNQTNQDQALRSTLDPKMYQYLYEFNQRSDLHGMTPEQRINTFYNVHSDNPDIQAMKDQMKTYGYGPQEFRRTQSLQNATMKADGGDIHIKPQNRGKFTAYKARTGKTTAEALQSSDPHVRQMANFARNSAHWKKRSNGGRMTKPFC